MGKDNQKSIVKLVKEPCDENNYYAAINLDAMNNAAAALDGNVFKLWIYFAKNNVVYENWELSSKVIERDFGIKKDAYNRAVSTLIEKGYLVEKENPANPVANEWIFQEIPTFIGKTDKGLIGKTDKGDTLAITLIGKTDKGLIGKTDKPYRENQQALMEKPITNITDITDITNNITVPPQLLLAREIEAIEEEYNATIEPYRGELFESVEAEKIKAKRYMAIQETKKKYSKSVVEAYEKNKKRKQF